MFDLHRFADDVSHSYHRRIVEHGKENQLIILSSFLAAFLVVRIVTHAIRAGRWKRVLRNVVSPGGTHFHHLVIGIALLLTSGYIGIGFSTGTLRHTIAATFGVGAALTLDEFALWLHLQDVYWTKEGRQSVDAVIIAATIAGLGVLGSGFWLDIGRAIARLVRG